MAVSTYRPQKQSNFSTAIIYVLAVVGVGLLIYLGINVLSNYGILGGKSGLSVSVLDGTANVYLDNELLGTTPLDSGELKAGEHTVRVENDTASYEVSVDFPAKSEVVLTRDLGVSSVFSSGQNFWVEKSSSDTVLSVISEPAGAKVFIDNTEVGATPYSSNNLSDGEYELKVERVGYEEQTARIKVQNGFKLNVAMKLFPVPVPSTVNLLEGSASIYDVNSNDLIVTSDAEGWARAVAYWNRTRGIKLGETGLNKEPVFDYFIDYGGRIYDASGAEISDVSTLEQAVTGAYLRRVSDGPGMAEAAVSALENVSLGAGKVATVIETGTGWLNVRSEPTLDGDLLQQINVGESYTVLEESVGWVRLRISADVDGWVSSTYVEIE